MLINKIETKDISVIVQGAINQLTHKCLGSVRKYLPDAKIILSTWEESNVKGLDYDILIESKDPGSFPCDVTDNSVANNVNRQLVSSLAGLKRCSSKYAIKMRTDFYLKGNEFLKYFGQYEKYNQEYKFVKSRIIGCTVYSRNPHSKILVFVMPYCPSDFFFFGYTEDILKLFDRELITSIDEKEYFEVYPEKRNLLNHKSALCRFMPEQSIWIGFLQNYISELYCDSRDDINSENQYLTELTIANNLILCSCEQLQIDSFQEKLFKKGIPENCITHSEWFYLYQFFCEGSKNAWKKFIKETFWADQKYKWKQHMRKCINVILKEKCR